MIVYETEWCYLEYARFFTNKAEAIRFAKQRVRDDETDARVNRLDIGKINMQKIIKILNNTSPTYHIYECGYVSRVDIVWESEPSPNIDNTKN